MSLVRLKNKKTGVIYIYESTGYWDKEKQQARNIRTCIGKINPETGDFIPSKRLAKKENTTLKPGPVAIIESGRRFFGATYLFDALGENLGVTADLKRCFPDTYKQILSIAYYLILEDRNPLSRFSKWARTHEHPFGKDVPSQRSSELFASIDEDSKQKFFRSQAFRRQEAEFLAYDTTSISSYSKSLKQVKSGWNKEHLPLQQVNLALLFGEDSRLPVGFRKLPGNIADVKTIRNLIADIDFLELKKVKLVMDRGFYSEDNINALYQKHYKFLIGVKTSLKLVKNRIDEVRDTITMRQRYSSKHSVYYDSQSFEWDCSQKKKRSGEIQKSKKRAYLHLFYNDQRATDDRIVFNQLLDRLENELKTGNRKLEHEKLYEKFYEVKQTPIRGVSITPKQEAISTVAKNYGYFALLSNGIKDPLTALEIYRSKDVIEKAFGNLKERLNMRRTSVSSEESLDGKLFVQFIALIFLSFIKKAMSDHNLQKAYTTQELLDELDVIECFEHPGRSFRVGEITKKQLHIYDCMGVKVPA